MGKEFVWKINVDGESKLWKCVLEDTEVITYEGEEVSDHLKITNPEVKQNVLQIDTVTHIFGVEVPFQLEKNVPYIRLNDRWCMSETTFEARKQKLLKDQKLIAYLLLLVALGCAAACLIRYLIEGTMGSWWFLLVLGSIIAATGYIQYRETKTSIAMLEQADA